MARIYIHSEDYQKRIAVNAIGEKVKRSLNGNDNLTFTVRSESKLDDDITCLGARVAIDVGNRYRTEYYLRELPAVELEGSDLWKYTFKFDAPIYMLNNKIFNILGERETAHSGTAEEFLDLIITALGGTFYKKGIVDSTDRKVLRFDNVNCLYALNYICDEFELEYELVYEKIGGIYQGTFNLQKQIGNDTAVTLDYFKGNAIKKIKRNNAGTERIITRLYYKGSTRNLPQGYSGARLNGSTEYIEANVAQYGRHEESRNFDEIMPEREGTVTSFCIDPDTQDHLLVDASFPFDLWAVNEDNEPIYMIPQTTPKITFNTGDCSGMTFEVCDYNHDTKEFKIIPWADEQGNETPNATVKPAADDTYKMTDIWLPSSYVADAVSRLDAAAQAYLDEHCRDKAVYEITLNPIWQSTNELGLNIGDRFSLATGYFNMHSGSRVTEMEFNPSDGRITKIKATDVKFAVQERKQAMTMKSIETAVNNNDLGQPAKVQKSKKTTNEVRMQIFDFKDQKIMPHKNKHEGLDPHYQAYDAREVQFCLQDVEIRPNSGGDNTKVSVTTGKVVHHTWNSKTRPEIEKLENKYMDYNPMKSWDIVGAVADVPTATTGYYCYAKIPLAEDVTTADIVFDPVHIPAKRDISLGYIYYKLGYIGKVINGNRSAHMLWGNDDGGNSHDEVTIAEGSGAYLGLNGQELSINLSSFATTSQLHNPLTIAAGSVGFASLNNQELTINQAGINYWTLSNGSVYRDTKVGVGVTSFSDGALTVGNNRASSNGEFISFVDNTNGDNYPIGYIRGYTITAGGFVMGGGLTIGTSEGLEIHSGGGNNSGMDFIDKGNKIMRLAYYVTDTGGRVGINTELPGANLHVSGNFKLVDGTQGNNKVLTSDSDGLASWQILNSSPWSTHTNGIYYSSGSVGVGTTPTTTEALTVSGTANITGAVTVGNNTYTATAPTANGMVLAGNTDGSTYWTTVSGGSSGGDVEYLFAECGSDISLTSTTTKLLLTRTLSISGTSITRASNYLQINDNGVYLIDYHYRIGNEDQTNDGQANLKFTAGSHIHDIYTPLILPEYHEYANSYSAIYNLSAGDKIYMEHSEYSGDLYICRYWAYIRVVKLNAGGSSGGAGTVTSVSAGNGMTFATITGSGSVTLGTPSTINGTTTNTVTADSHTHSLSVCLNDNSDVSAPTPSLNQVLGWDGSNWVNMTVSSGGVSYWGADTNGIFYSSGKVGIGTNSHDTHHLNVLGSAQFTGKVKVGAINITNVDGSAGQAFLTDGNGNTYWGTISGGSSLWSSDNYGINYGGKVGIGGISENSYSLSVHGSVHITGGASFYVYNTPTRFVNGDVTIDGISALSVHGVKHPTTVGAVGQVMIMGENNTLVWGTISGSGTNYWALGEYGIYRDSDNVGVGGVAQQAYRLYVNGNSKLNGTLLVNGLTIGATNPYTMPTSKGSDGQTFVIDSNGNVTWGAVSGGSSLWSNDDNGINYSVTNKSVGIGCVSDLSYKLKIAGTTHMSNNDATFSTLNLYNSTGKALSAYGQAYVSGKTAIGGTISDTSLFKVYGVAEVTNKLIINNYSLPTVKPTIEGLGYIGVNSDGVPYWQSQNNINYWKDAGAASGAVDRFSLDLGTRYGAKISGTGAYTYFTIQNNDKVWRWVNLGDNRFWLAQTANSNIFGNTPFMVNAEGIGSSSVKCVEIEGYTYIKNRLSVYGTIDATSGSFENVSTTGYINTNNGFKVNGVEGVTGTFTDNNGNTIRVKGGIIYAFN